MYCTKCGKRVKDGYAYCDTCGAPMDPGAVPFSRAPNNPVYNRSPVVASRKQIGIRVAAIVVALVMCLQIMSYIVPGARGYDFRVSSQGQYIGYRRG